MVIIKLCNLKLLSLQSTNLLRKNNTCSSFIVKFSVESTESKLNLSQICNEIKLVSKVLEEAAKSIKKSSLCGIMAGIFETSNDLNCCSDICKLLTIALTNNLIQFEARELQKMYRKRLFGINTMIIDDTKKLTFENVNKIESINATDCQN